MAKPQLPLPTLALLALLVAIMCGIMFAARHCIRVEENRHTELDQRLQQMEKDKAHWGPAYDAKVRAEADKLERQWLAEQDAKAARAETQGTGS